MLCAVVTVATCNLLVATLAIIQSYSSQRAAGTKELYGYSCKLRKATLRSDSAIEQVRATHPKVSLMEALILQGGGFSATGSGGDRSDVAAVA